MTKLLRGKPVIRETESFERGIPIIVDLHPRFVELRLKGERDRVTVPWYEIYDLGKKLSAHEMQLNAPRKRKGTVR